MPLPLLPVIFSGPGSNLYPLCDASTSSPSLSKALLPVANRPLVAYALQNLLSSGLTSCLLLAPSSQHATISRALSTIRLVPPFTPLMQGEKRRPKEERTSCVITIVDSLSHSASEATAMKVELLPLGPYDGKNIDEVAHQEGFRRQSLGTAELLRWLSSLGKLEADPLVIPVDLISPSMPLRDLIDLYINAQASSYGIPTACCALYERGAGDGTGRERERDGPPRMLCAYSHEDEKRLLLIRDADLSTDLTMRRSLLQSSPLSRLSTRLLDSHAYILNRAQVIPLLEANPTLTSLREHVLPLIAKASWMKGLREKANMSAGGTESKEEEEDGDEDNDSTSKRLARLSKDTTLTQQSMERSSMQPFRPARARRSNEEIRCLTLVSRLHSADDGGLPRFVARANTVPTYLECNRWLLKALSQSNVAPMAIPTMVADNSEASMLANSGEPAQAASAQISPDSLIGTGVRIGDRASIKRTVVGNRCEVGRGARLAGCVLLEGSKVMENARLENVIVCAGAVIGERSTLRECDVGPGVKILAETNAKNEKLVGEQEDDDEPDEYEG